MPCRKKKKEWQICLTPPPARPSQAETPCQGPCWPCPVPPLSAPALGRPVSAGRSFHSERKQCRCSSRCSPFSLVHRGRRGRELEMILIKCFLSRNKWALSAWNEGSRPYHKRQRQIFISEQKVSAAAYSGGRFFPLSWWRHLMA